MTSRTLTSVLLVLLSALCIGIASALIKLLLGRMTLFRLGFYRAFFGLLLTAPILIAVRDWEQWNPSWIGMGAGLLSAGVFLMSTFAYMKTVREGKLSIVQPIMQSYQLFVLLLSTVILGERVTLRLFLGTVVVIAGLCGLILGSPERIHIGSSSKQPVLWAFACSLVLGLLSVVTKLALRWISPVSLNLLHNAVVLLAYAWILSVQHVGPWRGVGWQEVAGQDEISYFASYVQAIKQRLGNRWPCSNAIAAQDEESLRRLHASGADVVSMNMEVWDDRIFAQLCPGKMRSIGYAEWIRRLVKAVDIYGEGNVHSTFVSGVEMVLLYGFSDLSAAVTSTARGFRFLMQHGVIPKISVWYAGPGSRLAGSAPPPLEFYIEIMRRWHETWHEFLLPPPTGLGPMDPGRATWSSRAFLDI